MAIHTSSYEGGIDRDSSKNKYPKGSYYKMKNFRLMSFDELSNGAVTSIKGNKAITILDTHTILNSDDIVIGWKVIRNYLVTWSTNCHDLIGGRGTILRTDLSEASPHWDLVYQNNSMMLSTKYPVFEEAIGYFESDTIVKVYWTDKFNMYRFINILSTGPASVELLNILSSVSFETPTVKNIGGGNIYVGKIQYAYQYYNTGGIETVFSPATPLLHLTKSSEGLTGSNIRLYEGSPALDDDGNPNNSGKSVTIQIVDADTNYDKIRVVAILYRNLNMIPEIHIVGEYNAVDNLMVTDYGVYTKGVLTLNAFRTLGNGELYCKTVSQKGNKALIGNITEKYFDIDFDARVYRHGPSTQVDKIILSGTNGRADIGTALGVKEAIFNTSLTQTAVDFVASYAIDFLATNGVILTSEVVNGVVMLVLTGHDYTHAFITSINNTSGSLNGTIYHQTIKVYNSKTASEEYIMYNGVWPNQTYLMNGIAVPEDRDCINPYNYDYLYPGGARIDEVATYSLVTDFSIDAVTGEPVNANGFKWQSDLVTLGGDGPNVQYEFMYDHLKFDESADTRYNQPDIVTIENLTSYDSYKNPLCEVKFMNYKHDEVYRHALVLTNTKGQDSFIKWIGDIKIPTVKEYLLCSKDAGTSTIMYPIGIKFTVNTTGLATLGVAGMRIVRVERTKEDRSIYSQGIISHMLIDDSASGSDPYDQLIVGFPRPIIKTPTEGIDAKFIKQTAVVQFISPEVNYFKDLSPASTDYIKLVSRLTDRRTYIDLYSAGTHKTFDDWGINERTAVLGASDLPTQYNLGSIINVSKYLTTNITGLTDLYTYPVVDGVMAGLVEWGAEDENKIILSGSPGGRSILNRNIDFDPGTSLPDHQGPSGTCAILTLGTDVDNSFLISADELEIYLIDYKRPGIAGSQYGGLTYESRQGNTYIECGPYIPVTTGAQLIECFGGDTYIDFHEHLRTIWSVDDNDGDTNPDVGLTDRFCNITMFPCETPINLGLSNGYKFSRYYTNAYIHALREEIGNWNGSFLALTGLMPTTDYDLIQDKNMYEYNSVYSQQNTTKVYFSKPDNWLATVHDDTLIKISEEKYPREEIDSYLKFLSDNEKILPTQFGPVNDLFLFKNYMIVFMDHAFGSLSIDERALLPIQNNSILELGSANNLQFFDFISDSSGSIHPSSVNKIGNGFGWFDAHLNSFGYYNGETQDIGLVKGISSVIKTYSDRIKSPAGTFYNNQLYGGNFLAFENKKYKELFCAMIVSELVTWSSNTVTSSIFTLTCSPVTVATNNVEIVINGVECYADITATTLTINMSDNIGFNPAIYDGTIRYFVYYKDYSKLFTFNSVLNSFQLEIDVFPQWLIEYNDDLFEIFNKQVVYKENEGNYGQFYGVYRYGEMEYIINPQRSLVCLFHNFVYNMEAIDSSGINQVAETWDSVRISNDYQYSVGLPTACITNNMFSRIDLAAHGLPLNTQLMLSGTAPTITGLTSAQVLSTIFYTINNATDSFQLSLTKGGTALVITSITNCYFNLLDAPLLVDTNVKRRMRSWRIKDLRDRNSDKPRMRDTYIRMLFRYLHGNNKRIVMHDLNTHYSVTRESLTP